MKEKKQARRITIFAIILSVIAIGILVFGFILVSSDKVVMLQSMSNIYNKLEAKVEDNTTLLNKISSSDNIGIKVNYKSGTSAGKIDYLENHSDKKSSLALSMIENSVPTMDSSFILEKGKLFMFLTGITPTYYSMDMDYNYYLKMISGDDALKTMELFKDAVSSSVSSKDVSKEKVTINYNGKDKKMNKLTYKVTNKELKEILKEFLDNFKKDDKLVNNVADLMGIKKGELIAGLTVAIGQLPDDEKLLMNYSTYYYGFNKIVEYDFDIPDSKLVLKYKVEKDKDTYQLNVEGLPILTVEKDNKGVYTFKGMLEQPFTGSYDGKVFKINYGQEEIVLNIKKESDYKYSYVLKVTDNGVETMNASFDIELYFDEKIEQVVTDPIDITTLTPEEQMMFNQILNGLVPSFDTTSLGGEMLPGYVSD